MSKYQFFDFIVFDATTEIRVRTPKYFLGVGLTLSIQIVHNFPTTIAVSPHPRHDERRTSQTMRVHAFAF